MTSGAATVHAQKVAYVATEAIVEKLPEAKAARSKLSELQLSWMREIQRQEQEISKLRGDIETNRLLWSAQEKRDADSRLADVESKLAAYRSAKFGPNQEYERQQTEMMGPIIERVSKAIEDEARAGKYDIVFDKSSRGMPILYANPAIDITWAVLKRLGVEPTEASGGAAGRVEPDSKREQDARRNRGQRDVQNPFGGDPIDPNKVLDPNTNSGGSGGTGTDGNSGKPE
jgi:outer membrane protein